MRKVVRDASTGKYSLRDVTEEEGTAIRAHMFRYAAAGRVIGDLFSPVLDFDATSGELKSASSSLLTLPERAVSEARALEQRVHATLLPAVGAVTAYHLIGNIHLSRINKALRDNKMLNYLVSRFGVLQQEDLKLYLTSKLIDYTYLGNKEGDGEPVRAFYDPRFRTVSLKTVYTLNDKDFVTTLAHEVAHHVWHVGLTADQKSAWIAHMRTAHPAFVQQTLERYKKIPDYFGELTTSEFALGGEVLATFVGEVLLGLGGPSLTVAVGKNVELVTDADILVLRDVGILHLDVVQALLAEREAARAHPVQTVPSSLEGVVDAAADAAVRVADADKEMEHKCSHCAVMARFLQEKFGRVRELREQVVLGQGDVSAARAEIEQIIEELENFLAKRRENRVQQETAEALFTLHKRVLGLARVTLAGVAPVSSEDVQKELGDAREEVQRRIAELEQRGASDAEHLEHEAWFALMDLKETIENVEVALINGVVIKGAVDFVKNLWSDKLFSISGLLEKQVITEKEAQSAVISILTKITAYFPVAYDPYLRIELNEVLQVLLDFTKYQASRLGIGLGATSLDNVHGRIAHAQYLISRKLEDSTLTLDRRDTLNALYSVTHMLYLELKKERTSVDDITSRLPVPLFSYASVVKPNEAEIDYVLQTLVEMKKPETARALFYFLYLAEHLHYEKFKDYALFGGISILLHLYLAYGPQVFFGARSSSDLDMYGKTKKLLSHILGLWGHADVRESPNIPQKHTVKVKDPSDKTVSDDSSESDIKMDVSIADENSIIPLQMDRSVPRSLDKIPPPFWDEIEQHTVMGIPVSFPNLRYLLRLKASVMRDDNSGEWKGKLREKDAADVMNILAIYYAQSANPEKFLKGLSAGELDNIIFSISKSPDLLSQITWFKPNDREGQTWSDFLKHVSKTAKKFK